MSDTTHFIGIGGIGMSSLARILLQQGKRVTGSDLKPSPITESLIKLGAKISFGLALDYLKDKTRVVVSSAIASDHQELIAARKKRLSLFHRSELLNDLIKEKKGLFVTGTHGKTTTSALLAWVFKEAGLSPSFSVGGVINSLETNGFYSEGEYFIAEADESDGTHTKYRPFGSIITNVGLDHMDHYQTKELLDQSMEHFCRQSHKSIICGDDLFLKTLPGIHYGVGKECDYRLLDVIQTGWTLQASFLYQGKKASATINLIGTHNAKNALAVFALAHQLGLNTQAILEGLKTFPGVKRRVEKRLESKDYLFIDDYAHHPTEIKTTLNAIRIAEPNRRLIAIFQPHRYSRTERSLKDYPTLFNTADRLIVTDIEAAGEKPLPDVGVLQVISSLQSKGALYLPKERLAKGVKKLLKGGDCVVTIGAGDITNLFSEIH